MTRAAYEDMIDKAELVIPGKLIFPEFDFPDNDRIAVYNNMMYVSIVLSVISIANYIMLFYFILQKRQRRLAIMRICGCTKLYAAILYLTECAFIVLPCYIVGIMFNLLLSKNIFNITLIELAVSIILVGVMVSAVMIRYKYYVPFKDIYTSKGIYCEFTVVIKYPDNTDTDDLSADQKQIASLGSPYSIKTDELNDNSIDYFYLQISNYLPIIIVVLIMTLVSSISMTALSTRQRLRDYAIYYICGSKWRSCAFVNLIHAVIISVLSSLAAYVIYHMIPLIQGLAGVDLTMTISLNIWLILSVTALISIYVLVPMIMPLIIIGRNTPKEILTGGNEQ